MIKNLARPIRSTIVWGLIGGLFYMPLCTGFSFFVFWPAGLHLTIWALLAGYGVFLTRWSSTPLRSIALPFLLLFIAAIFFKSTPFFLFSALAVQGWIRSGICFKRDPFIKRLGAETLLGSATAFLAAGAAPEVTPVWALGVLMFFLIQALYFVLFEQEADPAVEIKVDSFEKARMAAENILDSVQKEIII
jgi:hypothetical protein